MLQAGTSSEKAKTDDVKKQSGDGAEHDHWASLTSFVDAMSSSSDEKQISAAAAPDFLSAKWDPDDQSEEEWGNPPSPACVRRIKK